MHLLCTFRVLASLAAGLGLFTVASSLSAQDNRNHLNLLLLPTSQRAADELLQSCSLWSQQSIRAILRDVAAQYQISVWLDRRQDPSQIVELSRSDVPTTLADELDRVATSSGAAGGLVENVYLIAPADRLARIQRAAVVLHGQLASAHQHLAMTNHPLQWDDVISSQELMQLISDTWQIQLQGQVPHDLYHASRFPDSTLATQLSVLLGGFDLHATLINAGSDSSQSAKISQPGGRIHLLISPLSEKATWSDNYARSLTDERRIELSKRYAGSKLEQLADKRWLVQGETNLHLAFLAPKGSKSSSAGKVTHSPNGESQQQYTFSTDQALPVESILVHLGKSLGFQIQWSDQCSPLHRSRLIEMSVKNASREQLLKEICDRAGLAFTDQDTQIFLEPSKTTQP
ncbi:MAG TPA: hypothetical protein DCF63_08415 [Planctomycetaceae bacterium]|nr:hypothetical protein [Planctomycetaceae bacterium]